MVMGGTPAEVAATVIQQCKLILGKNLPDHQALKIALTSFYGIGRHTATRVMARYSIHDSTRVSQLTQSQLTSLTAFLSSPATSPRPPRNPLAAPKYGLLYSAASNVGSRPAAKTIRARDELAELKIESELRREVRDNIAHHRAVGTYVGRRHAMGLPVRGQNTRSNAKTARKLNKIERRG
ncbi:hypothetical protein BS47DRAFT_1376098 [Hydnum rufescens UP504]|uniref:Small ribosomal subunit protein uS13m n=1 Tax=Hydnum rufescens UP504 TaxID=1448309 RepID=A0A9P6DW44_9AGAM|nr:hypothetical protein BS47DRAFT_1376098 [Hydnum rufescens UP504]